MFIFLFGRSFEMLQHFFVSTTTNNGMGDLIIMVLFINCMLILLIEPLNIFLITRPFSQKFLRLSYNTMSWWSEDESSLSDFHHTMLRVASIIVNVMLLSLIMASYLWQRLESEDFIFLALLIIGPIILLTMGMYVLMMVAASYQYYTKNLPDYQEFLRSSHSVMSSWSKGIGILLDAPQAMFYVARAIIGVTFWYLMIGSYIWERSGSEGSILSVFLHPIYVLGAIILLVMLIYGPVIAAESYREYIRNQLEIESKKSKM